MDWYDRTMRRVRDLSSAGYRSGGRSASRGVAHMRHREVRTAGFPGGQSALHQALWVLCRPPLPAGFDLGCGQGTEAHQGTVKALELQYMRPRSSAPARQDPRQSASTRSHSARATTTASWSATWCSQAAIWFGGDDRSEASTTQFYAWLGHEKSSKIRLIGRDMWKPFRNVARTRRRERRSCSKSSTSCAISARRSTQGRIRTAARQGPALHQGAEVHVAVASRQSQPGWPRLAHVPTGSQQAPEHRLPAEGGVRTALELPARGLGPALLRQLARQPQMAAPPTLRTLRGHDRSPLGRHRCLLQAGEQGLAWFRRGPQQQDPGVPATRLRSESMRNTSTSKSSHACFRCYDAAESPTRITENPK